MSVWKISAFTGFALAVAVIYQNCSPPNSFSPVQLDSSSKVDQNEVADNGTPSATATPIATATPNTASVCVKTDGRYISILPWTNATDDALTDNDPTKPFSATPVQMDGQHIIGKGTIFGGLSTMTAAQDDFLKNPSPGSEWFLSFWTESIPTGGTKTTIRIDKNTDSMDQSLVCLFGKEDSNAHLIPNLKFENIGLGELINFVGHLSTPEKFISCRIKLPQPSTGYSVAIQFASAISPQTSRVYLNSPFVLRRGCYQ